MKNSIEGMPTPKPREQMSSPEPIKSEEIDLSGVFEDDIRPEVPETEGTVIVYQRNTDDKREPGPGFGELTKEGIKKTRSQAKLFFTELFEKMTNEEKKQFDILVLASDSKLHTPAGEKSDHKRAVETANEVIHELAPLMKKNGLDKEQLLNMEHAANGAPVEVSLLTDLRTINETPEYVEFLKQKAKEAVDSGRKNSRGKELPEQLWFWIMFEEDEFKEEREKIGAEGPNEIADRIESYLSIVKLLADEHHRNNPGRKMLIWAVSHGDTITPYVKRHVANLPMDTYLPVKKNGGLTIEISADGDATTQLSGKEFSVSFDSLDPDTNYKRKSPEELKAFLS